MNKADGQDTADRLCAIVANSLDTQAKTQDLARQAYQSRTQFHRLFRKVVEETPGAMRRRLLLERAAYHAASECGPRRFPLRAFIYVRSQYWNWRWESSSSNGVTGNRARFFGPGWMAMFCPRSTVASLRLILLLPSGAPRSTSPVLAPIVTLSSRPLPLFTA